MVIRKRAETDTVNPPGSIRNSEIDPRFAAAHYQDGRDLFQGASEHNEDESGVVQMAEYFRDKAE